MKKVLCMILALSMIFCLSSVAFAEDTDAVEEDEEIVDVTSVDEEPAEEPADAPAEEASEEPAEEPAEESAEEAEAPADEAEKADAEEAPEVKEVVNRGPIRAAIIAIFLIAFGGVVIFLGNKKSKGPKKPAGNKKD